MPTWIWEQTDWPAFRWREAEVSPVLARARLAQGRILGAAGLLDPYPNRGSPNGPTRLTERTVMETRRGVVWWADLGPLRPREQTGRRPVEYEADL